MKNIFLISLLITISFRASGNKIKSEIKMHPDFWADSIEISRARVDLLAVFICA